MYCGPVAPTKQLVAVELAGQVLAGVATGGGGGLLVVGGGGSLLSGAWLWWWRWRDDASRRDATVAGAAGSHVLDAAGLDVGCEARDCLGASGEHLRHVPRDGLPGGTLGGGVL